MFRCALGRSRLRRLLRSVARPLDRRLILHMHAKTKILSTNSLYPHWITWYSVFLRGTHAVLLGTLVALRSTRVVLRGTHVVLLDTHVVLLGTHVVILGTDVVLPA